MPSFRGMRQTIRGGAGYASMYGDTSSASRAVPPSPPKVVTIGGDSGPSAPALSKKEQRRKDKALKSINKNPLKPSNDPFGSPNGFEMSEAASDYRSAKFAEDRLSGKVKTLDYDQLPRPIKGYDGTMYQSPRTPKEVDQDTVGSYVATGKSQHSKEGQAYLAEHGSEAKRKKLDPYS